jgi:hypothetical protein
MKEFVARLKQLEWEHTAITESLRDPNQENENWIPWKEDEEQDYYGGLDTLGNYHGRGMKIEKSSKEEKSIIVVS